MSRTLGRVAALVVAAAVGVLAAPQTQPPSFVAGNRTVAVYATVTNARGRLMPDLTRDDFAIDDNGKRQTLTLFANDIQPITLVMLLDRSGSMKPNFDLEVAGRARRSSARCCRPTRRASAASRTSIQIEPDDFTSDHDALLKILRGRPADGRPDAALERGERAASTSC